MVPILYTDCIILILTMSHQTVSIAIPSCPQKMLYLVGKNAQGNFDILDQSRPGDLWFHVDGHHSGHVIACLGADMSKKQLRDVITQGALLCKRGSKYNQSAPLNVVYSHVRNVVKTPVLGSVQVAQPKYRRV